MEAASRERRIDGVDQDARVGRNSIVLHGAAETAPFSSGSARRISLTEVMASILSGGTRQRNGPLANMIVRL